MATSKGYRSSTRYKFSKGFRRNGAIRMKNYLTNYKRGDFVDIIVDGAIHKGMPHHQYHGKTAKVFNVNPRSIGVIVHKVVRHRKIEKRIHIRPEHLRISSSRVDFLERIKKNDVLKAEANKAKKPISTKRKPALPPTAHTVKVSINEVEARNVKPFIKIF